jgi:hypothetical protein
MRYLILTVLFAVFQCSPFFALGQKYSYLSQSSISIEKFENGAFRLTDSVVFSYNKFYKRSGAISIEDVVRATDYRKALFAWQKSAPYSEVEDFWPDGQGGYVLGMYYFQGFDYRAPTKNFPWAYDNMIERAGYKLGNEIEREKFEYKSSIPYRFDILTARVTDSMRQDYKINKITYNIDTVLVSVWQNNVLVPTMTIVNNGMVSTHIDSGTEHTIILRDYSSTPGPATIITIKGGTMPDDTVEMVFNSYGNFKIPETEVKMVQNAQGDLENYEAHYNLLDANGDKIEDITSYWNSTAQQWEPFMRGVYTYYSKGVLKSYESTRWDKQNSAWVYMQDTSDFGNSKRINIIYAVEWTTGIEQHILFEANSLVLYPSPSSDFINIQTTFTKPQSVAATITDMQGRVLRTWSEPSTKEYHRTIPVADLPAGNYVLKLNDMVKQFVVQ